MKDDGCGKTENKRERVDEEDGIFPFEGEDKGERVWIVLKSLKGPWNEILFTVRLPLYYLFMSPVHLVLIACT
jgi:hypothetical protein